MKKTQAFTIDKTILKKFQEATKIRGMKMSSLVEILIKKWLEENEKEK